MRRIAAPLALLLMTAACTGEPSATQPVQTIVAPAATVAVPPTLPPSAPAPVAAPTQVVALPAAPNPGVVFFSGAFSYTNDIVARRFSNYAVAMVDMYGFVKRDENWEIPIDSQTLGYMKWDTRNKNGIYRLEPPARPRGQMVDVDPNGRVDAGVQVFTLAFWGNRAGGPFAEGDDRRYGWPSYLTSVVLDPEDDEVTGGRLIVWAPDDQQRFPAGFGADKKLFTDDDPIAPLPAGYSVIDLDAQPFQVLRNPEARLALYEPRDLAIKDYSKLGYSDAFARALERIKIEYAFNGIPGKAPDWARLEADLKPQVAAAEAKRDGQAFYAVIRRFVAAFNDGHVGASAPDLVGRVFLQEQGGGFGLILRELDDGRVIVKTVIEGSPAARAGIRAGAQVLKLEDRDIRDAISRTVPFGQTFSTAWARRAEQLRFVLRVPRGARGRITYANKGEAQVSVTLDSAVEFDSLLRDEDVEPPSEVALPIEHKLLASGIGYLRVNSSNEDLELSYRLIRRAFESFEEAKVDRVIIDLRRNSGGTSLGISRFLIRDPLPVTARSYYFSEKTGGFETDKAPPLPITPNERMFQFRKVALLIGKDCVSACEAEAYYLSRVPGMIVAGHTPTAGVYAEVARGRFELPESISLQVPTGRTQWPDGTLFLEGTGVVPTLRVPVTEEGVLGDGDVVLKTVEAALK